MLLNFPADIVLYGARDPIIGIIGRVSSGKVDVSSRGFGRVSPWQVVQWTTQLITRSGVARNVTDFL